MENQSVRSNTRNALRFSISWTGMRDRGTNKQQNVPEPYIYINQSPTFALKTHTLKLEASSNPKSQTPNPKPQIPNPKPKSLNPKTCAPILLCRVCDLAKVLQKQQLLPACGTHSNLWFEFRVSGLGPRVQGLLLRSYFGV